MNLVKGKEGGKSIAFEELIYIFNMLLKSPQS